MESRIISRIVWIIMSQTMLGKHFAGSTSQRNLNSDHPIWDIGKQYSPRCDTAERGVPSGAILFTYRNFI